MTKVLDLILAEQPVPLEDLSKDSARDLEAAAAALAQPSILRTCLVLLRARRDEVVAVVNHLFKRRYWLERTSRYKPIYPLWTLRKVLQRTFTSHRWYNAELAKVAD